jgi:hypothetical protein
MRERHDKTMLVSTEKMGAEGGKEVGRKLKDSDYAVVFADIEQDLNSFMRGFRNEGHTRVIGCSSYGTLCSEQDGGKAVAYGISSADLLMGFSSVKVGKNPRMNGTNLAERAIVDIGKESSKLSRIFARYSAMVSNMPEKIAIAKPYYHMLLFTDPFQNCDEDIIRGIHQKIQRLSPLFGGSAYGKGEKSTLFCDRRAVEDGAAVALVATARSLGYGCENGLTLRGRKPYMVTDARDRIVYEINKKRAVEVYSEITGLSVKELIKEKWLENRIAVDYPFAVFDNEGKKWMKAPFTANEDGSISFMTRMAIGNMLFAAKSTQSSVVKSAEAAVKEALRRVEDPEVIFIFDCQQRKVFLGDSIKKESEAIKRAAKGTPFIGFYTMGEHLSTANVPMDHLNGTVIAVALGKN